MLPRDHEAVAAMLAILRVGAAYVPIDPAHPEARRRHITDSSGMRTILVADSTADSCLPGPEPVRLDELLSGPAATPAAAPTADTALHILYTSGSTGLPKGVQLSHRALATDVLAAIRHFGIGPDDAMLLKAPFTFDVSAHEMLVALVAGARLIVAPPDAERDPDLLAETLDRHGVTLLHAVPSQLRLLLEAEAFPANRTLRTVVSTGESLPNELRAAFEAAHPARLHNAYGPTETSYSTVFSWPRGEQAFWTERAEVPIGVPFDNILCYVLDDRQQLLPPGAPGELWIGGGTVSDGYVGDPERTADRYRRLDLGDGRTGPVYRTGDLVRLLPDGSLTHLGRLDDQVKVNGNRVELGEVRAALMAIEGVEDATVQVARHAQGSLQIVAYAVPHTLDAGAVRRAAGRALPSHMVPVKITPVERIPLLPNGKTDRQELARMAERATHTPSAPAAPRTPRPPRPPPAATPQQAAPKPKPAAPKAPKAPQALRRAARAAHHLGRPAGPEQRRRPVLRVRRRLHPRHAARLPAAPGGLHPGDARDLPPPGARRPRHPPRRPGRGRTRHPGPHLRLPRRPSGGRGLAAGPPSSPGSSATSRPTCTSGTSRCCWRSTARSTPACCAWPCRPWWRRTPHCPPASSSPTPPAKAACPRPPPSPPTRPATCCGSATSAPRTSSTTPSKPPSAA
ncbi:hypothetical protein GCM10020000_76500 [Streptomyces olivoverticillatus]